MSLSLDSDLDPSQRELSAKSSQIQGGKGGDAGIPSIVSLWFAHGPDLSLLVAHRTETAPNIESHCMHDRERPARPLSRGWGLPIRERAGIARIEIDGGRGAAGGSGGRREARERREGVAAAGGRGRRARVRFLSDRAVRRTPLRRGAPAGKLPEAASA